MGFKDTVYATDPNTGDLTPESRVLLGKYLSDMTRGSNESIRQTGGPDTYSYLPPRPNVVSIDPPAGSSTVSVDNEGPSDPGANGQPYYPGPDTQVPGKGASGYFDDVDRFNPLTDVVKASARSRLLVDVGAAPANELTEEMGRQVSVLLSKSRFGPGLADLSIRPTFLEQPTVSAVPQDVFGRFAPNAVLTAASRGNISLHDEMRKESLRVLLAATGELAKDPENPDSVVLPSPVQLGVPGVSALAGGNVEATVDTRVFRMGPNAPVLEPSDAEKLPGSSDGSSYTRYSYGNVYSYLEPFGATFSTSPTLTAAALIVVGLVALVTASAIVGLMASVEAVPSSDSLPPKGAERGTVDFGSQLSAFAGGPTAFLANYLGISNPYVASPLGAFGEYFVSAVRGFSAFVGFLSGEADGASSPSTAAALGSLASAGVNIASSPGYYVAIMRSIARNLDLLGSAASSIGGSVVGTIDGLAATADAIKHSKIFAFVNDMAKLGEIVSRENIDKVVYAAAVPPQQGAVDPSRRQSRSRNAAGSRRVAWSHSLVSDRIPTLLPKSVQVASAMFLGTTTEGTSAAMETIRSKASSIVSDVNLMDSDWVRARESELDSEYVPFYFHDLRTNDIVAFHAFLSELNDTFAPAYTTTEAYGRVDPVHVYKNTTRTIGLSFYVVATSGDDFDKVWMSINRLVNLVYPQWSRGNEVATDTFTFVQPFSQVPTASPFIRLRVGELFHSNYSRFSLARLFGLGSSTNSGQQYLLSTGELPQSSLPDTAVTVNKLAWDTALNLAQSVQRVPQPITIPIVVTSTVRSSQASSLPIVAPDPAGQSLPFGANTTRVTVTRGSMGTAVAVMDVGDSRGTYVTVLLDDPITTPDLVDASYVVLHIDSVSLKPSAASTTTATAAVASVFSPTSDSLKGNTSVSSIVRSFDESAGRGLAGVITSLGFDWNEAPWETAPGSRAPTYCKVTMQFSPVHDIPPGLDRDGSPRSSVYPVGSLVRSLHHPDLVALDDESAKASLARDKSVKQGVK